jgi:hypothetical protein
MAPKQPASDAAEPSTPPAASEPAEAEAEREGSQPLC